MPRGPQRQPTTPGITVVPEPKKQQTLHDRFPDYKHPEGLGELVNTSGIASRLGVSAPAVTNWMNRHADFPTPKVISGRQGLWDTGDVDAWHEKRYSDPAVQRRLNAPKKVAENRAARQTQQNTDWMMG